METVIYAKFSNERSRRFAIRTDILEDEKGRRRVRKEALYPEGREHVENICRWYALFSEQCRGTNLRYNHCEKTPEGIELEYVEGITLEDHLANLEKEQGTEAMISIFVDYLKRLRSLHDVQDFQETEAFREVFGEFGADAAALGLRCAPATNIDLICGNILMEGEGGTAIDYEWSFDFPIPLNYLLYRNIFYFRDHAGREYLGNFDFHKELGITPEEIRAYDKMEEHLQKYVCQEHIPVRDLYGTMSPGKVPMNLPPYQDNVQIFLDRGQGYREEDSLLFHIKEGECRIRLGLDALVKSLRIDPGSLPALVEIRRLEISQTRRDAWIPFSGGAKCLDIPDGFARGDFALFDQNDPKMYLRQLPEGACGLELDLAVWAGKEAPLSVIRRWLGEFEEQSEILEQMQNTKVWKMYQKYCAMFERKHE